MTKRPKTTPATELDPWEEGYVEPEEVNLPARLEPLPDIDEDRQMRSRRANEDEWVIKYPEGKRPPNQLDLRMREAHRKFLNVLSKTGSPKKASMAAGYSPRSFQLARKKFPDFDMNWNMAMEIYYQFEAEESIRHRAIDGTLKAIYYQGVKVGYERVYDSGLTQFWYKANMREKYGESSEIKITGNINHGVALLPSRATDMDAWEKRAAQTLENQKNNMIDITPTVVDTKPVPVQNTGQVKIER